MGLPPPEPLGEGRPDLHYFLLGDDAFALMACETLQQKTTHNGRENSKLQALKRQEGSGECIWNPSKQIQGLTMHNGTKAKGCQRYRFDVLRNLVRTHQDRLYLAE